MGFASYARITVWSQWVRFVIQIVAFVVLSRLLSPAEFGIVAMVMPIVTITALLADLGLGLAAIQAPTLSQPQKSTLFYVNVGAGVLGAVVIAASGPLLAWFYGRPELVALAPVLALPLLLTSLSAQARVELNRAHRFGVMALNDMAAAAAGLLAAVGAALAGFGYWALPCQVITQALVLAATSMGAARWRPTAPAPLRDVKALLTFGGHNVALQVANYASSTVDVMALGRVQGTTDLGIYSRSTQLVQMIFVQLTGPLTRVVLPRLGAAADDTEFRGVLARMQRVVAYVLLAAVSVAAAAAPIAAPLIFGEAWSEMGTLVQILCVGAALQALGIVYYWAFLSKARTGLLMLAELPGRAVMIIGALLAAGWGIEAVAAVMSLGQAIIFAASSITIRRIGVRAGELFVPALRPLVLAVTAFAVSTAASQTGWVDAIAALAVAAIAWLLVVGAAVALVPAVRRDARGVLATVRGR